MILICPIRLISLSATRRSHLLLSVFFLNWNPVSSKKYDIIRVNFLQIYKMYKKFEIKNIISNFTA